MALVAALAAAVGVSNAFTPRPLETHEIFVAQTSREMLAAGEWVLPTFNGEPRLNKPPLAYWLVMAIEKAMPSVVPVPEWKARLPSALGGIVLALGATLIGRSLYGSRVGFLAGLLVCASSGLFRYANNARPEMLYAACCAVMIWGLVEAMGSEDRSSRQARWVVLMWCAAGVAILAKGPHFPLLIVGGFVVHAVVEKQARRILPVLRPHWGPFLAILIAAPWAVLVSLRIPVAGEVWVRQLSDATDRHGFTLAEYLQPYYLWGLPQILLPWVVLLPFGLASPFVRGPEPLRRGRLLFWVFVAVFLALSLTTHRRSYYMLPMLAVLAPLSAAGTLDALGKCAGRWPVLLSRTIMAAVAVTVGFFTWLGTRDWVGGEGGERKDQFARAVAGIVGSDPVFLFGVDPGAVTYRLNRVTPEVNSVVALEERLGAVGAWVVAPPARLQELGPQFIVSEAARQNTGDSDENLLLVMVRRAGP